MMKIFFFVLIISAVNILSQDDLTPIQESNFTKLTTHEELSKFIREVDEKSNLIKREVITKSVQGLELYAVYFSKDEFGKEESKIKVLIFAQQHGNEQSGKEGALLLIAELLKPEYQYLFDKIDFCLVPQMNPDGSEANKRRNGNNMDLNRNHLILTEPETIALHRLFNKHHFEVTMDVHEYWPYGEDWKKYGYRRNFDETVGSTTNINVSQEIRKLSNESCIPFLSKYLNDNDFSFFDYVLGGPPEVDLMRYSTYDINDGRQSFGIQNTFSFIQEGMNGEDYNTELIEHRAKGQMTGMLALLKYSYDHKNDIKNLIFSEREKLINNKINNKVAIQLEHVADGNKLQIPLLSYYSNKDSLISVNDFRPVVKSLFDVERPLGYLIPDTLKEIKIWADNQNIKYYDKITGDYRNIKQYFITQIDSINFEGDKTVNPGLMTEDVTNIIDLSNYFFIPVSQIQNNMIVIALEPKSELGLVTYKKFEHLLKSGKSFPILRVIN